MSFWKETNQQKGGRGWKCISCKQWPIIVNTHTHNQVCSHFLFPECVCVKWWKNCTDVRLSKRGLPVIQFQGRHSRWETFPIQDFLSQRPTGNEHTHTRSILLYRCVIWGILWSLLRRWTKPQKLLIYLEFQNKSSLEHWSAVSVLKICLSINSLFLCKLTSHGRSVHKKKFPYCKCLSMGFSPSVFWGLFSPAETNQKPHMSLSIFFRLCISYFWKYVCVWECMSVEREQGFLLELKRFFVFAPVTHFQDVVCCQLLSGSAWQLVCEVQTNQKFYY